MSVVVPTWNEEPWLPRLLDAIAGHPVVDEVVVADFDSTDATPALALGAGCRLVEGGRPGPARNHGADVARGAHLLFVDADVVPSRAALDEVARLVDRGVGLAHFRVTPMSDHWVERASYAWTDLVFRTLHRVGLEQGLGCMLLVRRDVFERLDGFDDEVEVAEDVDFVRRAAGLTAVHYERDVPVWVSARRFSTEQPSRFILKNVLWAFLRIGGSTASPFGYRWVPHPTEVAGAESRWLARRAGPATERRRPRAGGG